MAENKEQDKMLNIRDRAFFLTKLNLVAGKYGLELSDIDVDFETWVIDIKKDMELYDKINLIADMEELTESTGGLLQ